MGVNYNSKIITDGLVFSFDIRSPRCFPIGGSIVNNLVPSYKKPSGELLNGASYSSVNGGQINFDGVDDRIDFFDTTSGPVGNIVNNFTVEVWVSVDQELTHEIDTESTTGTKGTTGQRYIIPPGYKGGTSAGFGISAASNGISTYEHSAAYMPPLLVWQGSVPNFSQIVIVYISKKPHLYLNGAYKKQGLTSGKDNVFLSGSNQDIAYNGSSYGGYTGAVSIARYYNRSLSSQEISNNYRAIMGVKI
jgi:hypothetical protein